MIEHDTPFPYQVDGDALGETRRLEFDYVPEAVKLVFPTPPRSTPTRPRPSSPTSSPAADHQACGRSAGATGSTDRARGGRSPGTSVHTPSTPRSASSTSRSGSFDVHTLTSSPAAWHRSTSGARDDALPGMDGGVSRGGDPLDASVVERHAEEGGGDLGRRTHGRRRSWPTRTTRSASGPIASAPRRRELVERRPGDRHRRVEPTVGRQVLDLDVHQHLARRTRRAPSASVGTDADSAPSGASGSWRTSSSPDRREPNVELDAVGSLRIGEAERLDGVLRCVDRCSTMGDHEHRRSLACQPRTSQNRPLSNRVDAGNFAWPSGRFRPAPPGGSADDLTFEEHQTCPSLRPA